MSHGLVAFLMSFYHKAKYKSNIVITKNKPVIGRNIPLLVYSISKMSFGVHPRALHIFS